MNADKDHYRVFLELCLERGVAVCADKHLFPSKSTYGHWNGKNHISVDRPSLRQSLVLSPGLSTAERLARFIDGSPNVKWETAILLHEYGHWKSKHPHLSQVDKATGYQHEVEAWEIGRQVGLDCGVDDFSVFDSEREKALKGYREGLGLA